MSVKFAVILVDISTDSFSLRTISFEKQCHNIIPIQIVPKHKHICLFRHFFLHSRKEETFMKPFQGRLQKTVRSEDWTKKYFFREFYNFLSGSESKQDKMSSTKKLVLESNKTVVLTSYCDSYCL